MIPALDEQTAPAPAGEGAPAAVARIYGRPVEQFPLDLYVPPQALEVFLETFEGPLDLLLYLIRKANIDILDIPMAPLTAQYLEYVEQMRRHNLDLAADYLVMAAVLLEIKSRLLLPKPVVAEDEADDPRAELVRRLIEYEQMKRAAEEIDGLPRVGRDFSAVAVAVARTVVERQPNVDPAELQMAWLALLRRSALVSHHRIAREELSVREHMSLILRRLQANRFAEFASLFDVERGIASVVVTFLAILELAREQLVEISQAEPLAPIYVRLADGGH